MLTLEDLGVLRSVDVEEDGRVVVTITPTYSGCPAMATMRDDLVHRLPTRGSTPRSGSALRPAWSSDWITPTDGPHAGRPRISPPGAGARPGPVALSLLPTRRALTLSPLRIGRGRR